MSVENEKTEFNLLLESLNITIDQLSDYLGIEPKSMRSMLSGSKPLPKWARSMILVNNSMRKQNVFLTPSDSAKFMEIYDAIYGKV